MKKFGLGELFRIVYSPPSFSGRTESTEVAEPPMRYLLFRLFRPVLNFLKIFSKDDSPRQLALGLALGFMIGLIPKGNLVAASLTVLLFAFRFNVGIALLTTFVVSPFSTCVDPLTHGIGVRLLKQPWFYHRLESCYEWPIVPWTSLNNTVVLGGLTLGLVLFYPVYHVSESLFQQHYDTVKTLLRRSKKKGAPSPSVEPELTEPATAEWRHA